MMPCFIFCIELLLYFSEDILSSPMSMHKSIICCTYFLCYFRPSWSKKIIKLLRPIYITFIIFMFTFGIYVNQYIFRLFTPILILAGCMLPWIGFFFGAIIAFFTRQPFDRIKTIAIETGIQNAGKVSLNFERNFWNWLLSTIISRILKYLECALASREIEIISHVCMWT